MAKVVSNNAAGTDHLLLDLSAEEAATLAVLFSRVGGSPTRSLRGTVDEISRALVGVGFVFSSGRAKEIDVLVQGGISFEDSLEPFVPGYYRDNSDGEVLWHSEGPSLRYWTRVKVLDAENNEEYTAAE